MPANLENSAVATGLEKVSFHFNSKERQCQRMLKLLHNGTHLTHYQSNAQNSPSQASTKRELWTSRCSSWFQKRQRNQRTNSQHLLDHRRSKSIPEQNMVLNWKRSTSRLYIVTLLIQLKCRVHHVKCCNGWSLSWYQDCQEKYQ